jgi:hypothetical protein
VAIAVLLTIGSAPLHAQVNDKTMNYFPFAIPPLDTSPSFTDLSSLNEKPAGERGPVTVRDGHFVDGAGKRLRFLGTNMVFGAAFPPKDLAPAIAGHLAKYGINVVRFHHMDGQAAPRGIWKGDFSGFDPEQLDRLDWFVAKLRERGIYANLNLHVSHQYPGLPSDLPPAFGYGKGIDQFHEPFIAAQEAYARDLLTHRNPYTKTTYAEERAVAFVEINNENSLTDKSMSDLAVLPEPFASELAGLWRAWLKAHYADTAALRVHWNEGSQPLGEEMLANGDFAQGLASWAPEQQQGAVLRSETVANEAAAGGQALHLTAEKAGQVDWAMQVTQRGLTLGDGKAYTLSFWGRAERAATITVAATLDQAPWTHCGLTRTIALTPEWRQMRLTFEAQGTVPGHCRVGFDVRNAVGNYWVAGVSLRPGGWTGLADGQTLEAGNVATPGADATRAARADYLRFLSDTERGYAERMTKFVKDTLGVKAVVSCTQGSYGGRLGLLREAAVSDYIDMHAYWQHPRFPHKAWDQADWLIENTPMTGSAEGGTLAGRAWMRVAGMPYVMSEYDHPAPSDYVGEMYPMLASFAAFQDWDGLYSFAYSHSPHDTVTNRISGFFDQVTHPVKMVFLPVAAVMFRMGGVAAGGEPLVLDLPREGLALAATSDAARSGPGVPRESLVTALLRPVAVRLTAGAGEATVPGPADAGDLRASNTNEIAWNLPGAMGGWKQSNYTVNAPSVRAAVGFIGGREITLGDVTIHVKQAKNNWAAVAVAALDGKPMAESQRVLVVVTGRAENSNMEWNPERTSVGAKWGDSPTVVEGVAATIRVPGGGHVHPLDQNGNLRPAIDSRERKTTIEFDAEAQYRTLWYAVVR